MRNNRTTHMQTTSRDSSVTTSRATLKGELILLPAPRSSRRVMSTEVGFGAGTTVMPAGLSVLYLSGSGGKSAASNSVRPANNTGWANTYRPSSLKHPEITMNMYYMGQGTNLVRATELPPGAVKPLAAFVREIQ